MECQPLVSIVVNNYNYAQFLTQAIDSALSQTYPHTEVIVVDDGSTDNSGDVIASYGDRIIAIFQTNGKQGKAFNSGFAASKGEIIIFLDADDYLYPYAVERIVGMWEPKFTKVHYYLDVVDANGESRGFSYPQGNQPLSTGEVWRSVISVGTYRGTPTSGNALNRKAMENVFPIPDEFNTTSDDYLSVLIPLYGEVAAIEEPLGAYRIHTTNQWALTTVSAERIRRFVRHDLQRCVLLQQKATELGYEVPHDLNIRFFGRVWSRLASLKLEPQEHLVKSDRSIVLMYWGIRALWKYSSYNWQKRVIFSLWFIWVALMPLPLAKPAINWLFAPQFRPKVIAQTLNTIRLLVSRRVAVK
ncbi:MAG: glycosyltransferase [Tolypothrix carrinoi HA7290-LM1]|nr:glycosyltransferase [Tolypothrix carrinoi HA7290-LM1]